MTRYMMIASLLFAACGEPLSGLDAGNDAGIFDAGTSDAQTTDANDFATIHIIQYTRHGTGEYVLCYNFSTTRLILTENLPLNHTQVLTPTCNGNESDYTAVISRDGIPGTLGITVWTQDFGENAYYGESQYLADPSIPIIITVFVD